MEKKIYKYNKCSSCKQEKEENRSPYCKKCSKEYKRQYTLNKILQPNVNIESLGRFIKKVKDQNYVTLYDINGILFFYEIITSNINEYDSYKFGKQIRLMWERINKHYDKYKKDISNK